MKEGKQAGRLEGEEIRGKKKCSGKIAAGCSAVDGCCALQVPSEKNRNRKQTVTVFESEKCICQDGIRWKILGVPHPEKKKRKDLDVLSKRGKNFRCEVFGHSRSRKLERRMEP